MKKDREEETQKQTILFSFSKEEMGEIVQTSIQEALRHFYVPQKVDEELLTRKQVSILLKISLVTVNDFSKRGILTAYRIGTRIRYKKSEVMENLNEIHYSSY